MADDFLKCLSWITEVLKRPVDCFAEGSTEHAVVTRLKQEWGKRDTAELLKALTAEYGADAIRAVEEFLKVNIVKDWQLIGKRKARPGTEIEDFVHLLWDPLPEQGFQFSMTKKDGKTTFRVTRCPHYELAERTGLHDWLYHLTCATDYYTTPSFSPKIVFTRTKTLMQHHDCCDHQYSYGPER